MSISHAAALIRDGKLVAFPTETVYGLGANALDVNAVARIFAVKGRPASSPLIVHVDSIEMAQSLVREWPMSAETLSRRYWPGPLTLVLEKQPKVPDLVTAGLPTVAVRMPSHPLALALISEAGLPIAAPSANRFTELSPTTAEHVRKSLGDSVDLILDGGPTAVGIESTVLSLADGRAGILRPGMISRTEIEALIGPVDGATIETPQAGPHPSPGMHNRHYSPATPLHLVRGGELPQRGRGAYLWINHPANAAHSVRMPQDPTGYAAVLYDKLHQIDRLRLDWIAVERPPETPEWAGINDRLQRSSF
jgi:L-threonylcarbamoyladenylate synthase